MDVDVREVIAELGKTELGRALWERALAQVEAQKLREEVARLRNEQQGGSPTGTPDGVPPAGEPDPVPAS